MAKRGPRPLIPRQPPKTVSQRHFLKEWRIYRGLTQEALAAEAGMVPNNLSQLENKRFYLQGEALENLAQALKTTPGQILDVNPLDDSDPALAAFVPIWADLDSTGRQVVLETAKIHRKRSH